MIGYLNQQRLESLLQAVAPGRPPLEQTVILAELAALGLERRDRHGEADVVRAMAVKWRAENEREGAKAAPGGDTDGE